jgi:hypothetical protein
MSKGSDLQVDYDLLSTSAKRGERLWAGLLRRRTLGGHRLREFNGLKEWKQDIRSGMARCLICRCVEDELAGRGDEGGLRLAAGTALVEQRVDDLPHRVPALMTADRGGARSSRR